VGALPAESRAKLAAVLEILRSEKCLPEAAATVRA
jgi:hypothetical protein